LTTSILFFNPYLAGTPRSIAAFETNVTQD
jgi:hypothetical protein